MQNQPRLLEPMLKTQRKSSYLFKPGPYWQKNTLRSVREIRKKGISNFRSFENNSGQAFTDSPFVDIRPAYNIGIRRVVFLCCTRIPLISKVFKSQIQLTISLFQELSKKNDELLRNSLYVNDSLTRIKIPQDSVRGGL